MTDSPLTIHGSLQADRLGKYFAQSGLCFTNIFSSDLQRAFKTANAIFLAQKRGKLKQQEQNSGVVQLRALREQDFGSFERKPFSTRRAAQNPPGKEFHPFHSNAQSNFQDGESKESLDLRLDGFIQDYLFPLFQGEASATESAVCIVSHGIALSHLWRCLLKLFHRQNVRVSPNILVDNQRAKSLEYLGGWSNTGFLELDIQEMKSLEMAMTSLSNDGTKLSGLGSTADHNVNPFFRSSLLVRTLNGREHLISLKRTRGGVGSSQYDAGQRKLETYFKKKEAE